MIRENHKCPELSKEDLAILCNGEPAFITRHIEAEYLSSALNGYFRLGTLMGYRATEDEISGRLGDPEESRQQESFNSSTSRFKSLELDTVDIANLSLRGVGKHVVVETLVNDFCSCSSIGEFDSFRGQKLKDVEHDPQKKPGAFVTYDVSKLKKAIKEWLRTKRPELSSFEFVGRRVEYGQKDRAWEVEENFKYQRDRDSVGIWLAIAFVKASKFAHEEEFRLLLVDPEKPGGLARNAATIVIAEDSGIASAIIESGFY